MYTGNTLILSSHFYLLCSFSNKILRSMLIIINKNENEAHSWLYELIELIEELFYKKKFELGSRILYFMGLNCALEIFIVFFTV